MPQEAPELPEVPELVAEGSDVVVLDPDVAELFKTSESVNEALREVARSRRAGGA